MVKSIIIVLLCSTFFVSSFSQELMKIGKESVSVDEFLKIYQKNNNSKASFSQKDINDYLDLFTLYKMKLQEAHEKKLDTLPVIKEDYIKYSDQLLQNMSIDKNYVDNILRQEYEHMKYDVKVAHIMVKCPSNASPQDSLLAYNKLKFLSDKVNKDNFATIAKESSEDNGTAANGGVLGYITAFMTFPDFEDQCYKTPVGQISPIFRTQFGYHILHILDKRQTRGKIKVAHIYMKNSDDKSEEKQMKEAYSALIAKKIAFGDAVKKYSQDASTKDKQGELPEFGVSEMVQEFEDQCFALNSPGDISKPFKTEYGWHLVKLIEKKPIQPYESVKDIIKQKMERDPRLANMKDVMMRQLETKYNLKENIDNLSAYKAGFADTFFMKKNWSLSVDKSFQIKPLFSFDNQVYSLGHFVNYANKNYVSASSKNKEDVFRAMYMSYKERMILDAVKNRMRKENEDFKNLDNEYMNGLLIFEIMDREIWKKAISDTVGAKKLYEKVKNDYWYKDRVVLEGIRAQKAETLTPYTNRFNSLSAKQLLTEIKKTKDSNDIVYYEKTIEKGDLASVDVVMGQMNKVVNFVDDDKMNVLAKVAKVLSPSIKSYNDIKGRIQNLYQNQIEAEWANSLRKKYPIQINQIELNKLIKN